MSASIRLELCAQTDTHKHEHGQKNYDKDVVPTYRRTDKAGHTRIIDIHTVGDANMLKTYHFNDKKK